MKSKSIRFFAAVVAGSLVASSASWAQPSGDEMFMIHELNRARNDAARWASETGLDLLEGGDGQLATLAGLPSRPPLAVNETLIGTALYRANDMATYNYFAHQNQDGRWPNAVLRDAGYDLPSQLYYAPRSFYTIASDTDLVEGIDAFYADPVVALMNILRDSGDPGLHHRKRFLGINDPEYPDFYIAFREVGAGYAYNDAASYDHYWALHVGFQQKGTNADPSDPLANFVTGVVFDDANDNDRYDSGEGLPGVEVTTGAGSVTTNDAGGYAIEVANGSHVVSASGGGFSGSSSVAVEIAAASREVDFESGEPGGYVDFVAVPEPSFPLLALSALVALGALRSTRKKPIPG